MIIGRRPNLTLLFLVGLLLAAFALRLFRLDYQSIWWDEGISLHLAASSLSDIIRDRLDNIHPPLYFFILKAWLALVGVSPLTARYLSALASLFQVALVFAAVRHWNRGLNGTRPLLPWIAAGLMVLSPLSVIYGQEIRVYAMLPLVYLAMVLAAGQSLDSDGRRIAPLIVLGLSEWLALHLHYISLFGVIYVGLWGTIALALKRDRPALKRWFLAHGLVAVACLPWFVAVVNNMTAIRAEANAGTFTTEAVPLPFLFAQVWAFHLTGLAGSLASQFVRVGAIIAAALVVALLVEKLAAVQRARNNGGSLVVPRLAAHWFLPLISALIVWNVRSFSHPRYIIIFAGMFIPLAALLIYPSRQWLNRIAAFGLAACLLALSIWGLQTYFFDSGAAKPDMRGVARYLEANTGTGDLIIIPDTDWSLTFEYQGVANLVMPHLEGTSKDSQSALIRALDCSGGDPCAESGRVFVVDYSTGTRDWQGRLPFELERRGHLLNETSFDDLIVQVYQLSEKSGPLPDCEAPDMVRPQLGFGPLQLESVWVEEGAAADTAVTVAICWDLREQLTEDYVASLILTDPVTDERLAQSDTTLVGLLGQPTSQWLPGDSVVTFHQLFLPVGTPPIDSALAISVYPQNEGTINLVEAVDSDGRIAGRVLPVGEVSLSSPVKQPDAEVMASLPIWDEPVQVYNGLELLGARFNSGPYRPGQTIRVGLVWRATAENLPDYRPVLVLVQGSDILAENGAAPVNGRYPTDRWRMGEVITEYRDVRIPPGTEGDAELMLQSSGRVDLGQVTIDAGDIVFDQPPISKPVNTVFSDQIALIGYDLPQARVDNSTVVPLTLYWNALSGEIENGYTVFVHLIAADGRVIAQHDMIPAEGRRPTDEWLLGEYIVDNHELSWREPGYAGPARIAVGMYDPETGERLLTAEGADQFLLPVELTVETGL